MNSPTTTEPVNPAMTDPRAVLTDEELASATANVHAVPRLSPAQLDRISAVFRPITRQMTHARHTRS